MGYKFVKIRDLKKDYYNKKVLIKEALKNISFDIYEKEILSLLGVNGAGKTTLSSILATLIPPTSGTILFHNQSIYKNIMQFRKQIGFCPQNQNLDIDLTLDENLTFAGKYFKMPKEDIIKKKEELLEKFDLKRYRNYTADLLSGGYQRRFMIARTMMHSPKLLILDEPTVGLDPQMRRKIWQYILHLKEENVTILLTTHYLDEADILSDRVCVIDEGEIKTIDSPKNLKSQWKKENLEEIFLHLLKEKK